VQPIDTTHVPLSRPVREAIANRIVRWVLAPMAVAALVSMALLATTSPTPIHFALTSGWFATTAMSAYFARRKLYIPSAALLCIGLSLVTGSSALLKSVHSLGFVANVVVMALVVPLFGARWGWAVALWTLLTGGMWLALSAAGLSAPIQKASDLQAYVFTVMIVLLALGVTALPARLLGQALQSSESRLQALERAQAEEKRAAAELHKVSEQLAQARRLDALGKLAGGVAHDFNNMLSAIVGATELISMRTRQARTPELDENIALLRAATERAADLTRKLLAFGRKGRFPSEPYNVSDLVSTVTTLARPGLGREIKLTTELPERPLLVWGDPSSLEHALLNLVLNSRDACAEGGRIAITARLVELDNAWCDASGFEIAAGPAVKITVEDDGAGMTPDVQARAFEPFFSTKPAERGTGLGLSAVHGTVMSHKGAIEVQSEPGAGTVFHVYLPLYDPASARHHEDQPSGPIALGDSAVHARGNTVLVVDDNALNLRAVSGLIRELGYDCEAVTSPRNALRIASERADILAVVSDIVMPEMDGAAFATALAERVPALPVVLMSGFAPEATLAALPEGRPTRVLRKPFRREELEAALREAAGDRRAPAQPPREASG